MIRFSESGFRVAVPRAQGFRFSELRAYRVVCGQSVKEVDVCWFDPDFEQFVLLELKQYRDLSPEDVGRLAPQLSDKFRDAMTMLASAWASTSWGACLLQELPVPFHRFRPIEAVVGFDVPEERKEHLLPLRDSLRARLWGRMKVMGGKPRRPLVVDGDMLVQMFPKHVDRA